jgi:hypothetical protein
LIKESLTCLPSSISNVGSRAESIEQPQIGEMNRRWLSWWPFQTQNQEMKRNRDVGEKT